MGQCKNTYSPGKDEKEYFKNQKKEMQKHFTRSERFLENSSEWVVVLKEELGKYSRCEWARPLLLLIRSWESYHDTSSRVTFVWNQLSMSRYIPIVDQSRACMWPQSIANLQTFTYEIESDPHKKTLNGLIQLKKDCTIYRIIKTFKVSLFKFYGEKIEGKSQLKEKFLDNMAQTAREIDEIVLDFIRIIVKILPKFFIDFPSNIHDVEEIVRNAIVSDNILNLLITVRKSSITDIQREYVKNLAEFDNNFDKLPITSRLENDKNEYFLKAIGSLSGIRDSQSIGELHDLVAMIMNYISMGLFDENSEDNMLAEEEIIEAFFVIIGKSGVTELPFYIDILNTFLDQNTLTIKGVGQGIVKLTYIINNSINWNSFINNINN